MYAMRLLISQSLQNVTQQGTDLFPFLIKQQYQKILLLNEICP